MSGSLTHPPADVLRYLLIAKGLGTLPTDGSSWPIYTMREPNKPDSCISIFDTSGRLAGFQQTDGEAREQHGVNIRIRADTERNGYVKARAIEVALDESIRLDSQAISTSVYLVYAVTRTSGVLFNGREPTSDRSIFTINAVVTLRQTT